jgi:hypothetical protein
VVECLTRKNEVTCSNTSTAKRKKVIFAECWWHMPIILATEEAEIRRITIQSQFSKKFMRANLKKTHHKKMAGGVPQGIGSEFKLQCGTKNKNRKQRSRG